MLRDDLAFVWRAFWSLNGDRPASGLGGRAPIAFAAIDAYAARYGIASVDEFDRFHNLIRALDRAYLEWKPPDDD